MQAADSWRAFPLPQLQRLPVRVCARVIGDQLSFKAWRPNKPDPGYGAPITIPSNMIYAGYGGDYIGHLNPSGATAFTHLLVTTEAP